MKPKVEPASHRLSEGRRCSPSAPSSTPNASQIVELGKVILASTEKTEPTQHSTTPYIGLEHIDRDLGTISSQGTVSDVRSTKSVFRKGDLLYGKLRPYLNKVWVAQFDGVCSTDILVYPKSDSVDNAFLKYRFLASDFVRYASENSNGVNLPRVNAKALAKFPIWLPQLREQHRIVEEIEKQFTRLDAGVTALKRVQANLKRYRAAVLKSACEGRLVPTEAELARKSKRPFETGEQLLTRILREREKNWQGRGKYKSPAAPDTTNLPPLPEGWTWASIDQICGHITSGSRDWSQYYGKGSGTFILAQNVRPMRLDMSERQPVAAPKGDTETERTRVRKNDVLVTIVGAKTGDICRIPLQLKEHYVCQSVALMRPVDTKMSQYLELYLASPENGQAIWKRFIYGQGRPHLGFDELCITAVALPPIAEQTRIVAEVEHYLSIIDKLETLVTTNLARANHLKQSTLQKVFEYLPASAHINTKLK